MAYTRRRKCSHRDVVIFLVIVIVLSEGLICFYTVVNSNSFSRYVKEIHLELKHKRSVTMREETTTKMEISTSDMGYHTGPSRVCPPDPPGIQDLNVTLHEDILPIHQLEKRHPEVELGGSWAPPNCTARHHVAIIVPYRDREEHLKVFLRHMHPFLQTQQLHYTIFVVELTSSVAFNRGFLLNVGFMEALKTGSFQCVILHDVDLVPETYKNRYSCPKSPLLMAVARSKSKYRMPYPTYFGGVGAMSIFDFQLVNGFSNRFFGWGAEDDDFRRRIVKNKLKIQRLKPEVGRYKAAFHKPEKKNPKRLKILASLKKQQDEDGLTTLKYKLLKFKKLKLYTWILAEPADT